MERTGADRGGPGRPSTVSRHDGPDHRRPAVRACTHGSRRRVRRPERRPTARFPEAWTSASTAAPPSASCTPPCEAPVSSLPWEVYEPVNRRRRSAAASVIPSRRLVELLSPGRAFAAVSGGDVLDSGRGRRPCLPDDGPPAGGSALLAAAPAPSLELDDVSRARWHCADPLTTTGRRARRTGGGPRLRRRA